MAIVQHAEPMEKQLDHIPNAHLAAKELHMEIVHHVKQTVIQLDHIPNAHLAAKELHMEIVHHAERMAKETAHDLINHVLPANAVLLENAHILKH
jgi:hypothetical protein